MIILRFILIIFLRNTKANKLNKYPYLYFGRTIYSEVGSGKFDSVTTDLLSEDYKKDNFKKNYKNTS